MRRPSQKAPDGGAMQVDDVAHVADGWNIHNPIKCRDNQITTCESFEGQRRDLMRIGFEAKRGALHVQLQQA